VRNGRLTPTADAQPLVDDVTLLLKYTVQERGLHLFPNSYPMANKLILDVGDFDTLSTLLRHALSINEVNSSR
jgi:hypothetical protein